ncbi:hypothetical protein E3O28_07770 [Cryobacterium sp. TMT2-14]|nr:hypothetical protein E3O28_07770 [Cryobacterium sp. TMT2-14]
MLHRAARTNSTESRDFAHNHSKQPVNPLFPQNLRRIGSGQGRAGQGRAGQGRAGQGRAGQGSVGQRRAAQGSAESAAAHT